MSERWREGDTAYWNEQARTRFAAHVAPLNELVANLIDTTGRPVPFVPPSSGGLNAPAMYLLTEPDGALEGGSGWISARNDDRSSARQRELLTDNHVRESDLLPWNAHPLPRHGRAGQPFTEDERRLGGRHLVRVLGMMSSPRILFVQGAEAAKVTESVKVQIRVENPNLRVIFAPGVTVRTREGRATQLQRWAEFGATLKHVRGH